MIATRQLLLMMVLAIPFFLESMMGNAYAEGLALEQGVVLSEDVEEGASVEAITCTLDISPPTVPNGQTFGFSVIYSPCLNIGTWTENFIFNWPSALDTFGERTVRTKIFKDFDGCVGSSGENAVVPTATAITGTFKAKVIVRGVLERICSATAPMTVE